MRYWWWLAGFASGVLLTALLAALEDYFDWSGAGRASMAGDRNRRR